MYPRLTPLPHLQNNHSIDPRLLVSRTEQVTTPGSNSSSTLTGAGQWIDDDDSIPAAHGAYTQLPNGSTVSHQMRQCGCFVPGYQRCQHVAPRTLMYRGALETVTQVPAQPVPDPATPFGHPPSCDPYPPTSGYPHHPTPGYRHRHQHLRPEAQSFSPSVSPRRDSQTPWSSQQPHGSQQTSVSHYSHFQEPGQPYYASGLQPGHQTPNQSPSVLSNRDQRSSWNVPQTPAVNLYPTPPTTGSVRSGRKRSWQYAAPKGHSGQPCTSQGNQAEPSYGGPRPPSLRQIARKHGQGPARPSALALLQETYNVGDRLRQLNEPRAPDITNAQVPASQARGRYRCLHDGCTSKGFDRESALNQHERMHGPKDFKCEPCGFQSVFEKDLKKHNGSKKHRKKVGAVVAASEASAGKVVARVYCLFRGCERSRGQRKDGFARKDHLKRHMPSKHPGILVPGLALDSQSACRSTVPADDPFWT